VTVAAETGLVGLALFVAFVGALLAQAFRRSDRSLPGSVSLGGTLSLAGGLVLAAILCHSFFYNDFFEDPTTWGLFGLIALATAARPARAAAEEPAPAGAAKEAVPV
jgi:O-antigen ligase